MRGPSFECVLSTYLLSWGVCRRAPGSRFCLRAGSPRTPCPGGASRPVSSGFLFPGLACEPPVGHVAAVLASDSLRRVRTWHTLRSLTRACCCSTVSPYVFASASLRCWERGSAAFSQEEPEGIGLLSTARATCPIVHGSGAPPSRAVAGSWLDRGIECVDVREPGCILGRPDLRSL